MVIVPVSVTFALGGGAAALNPAAAPTSRAAAAALRLALPEGIAAGATVREAAVVLRTSAQQK